MAQEERLEPYQIGHYVEDVGKTIKATKTMYKWSFSFGPTGEEENVMLKLSGVSGKKELRYNGELKLQTQAFDTSRFQHTWIENGRQFQIGSIRKEDGAPVENASLASLGSFKYTFAIDGVAFENFKYRGFGATPANKVPQEASALPGAKDETAFTGSNPAFGGENFGTFAAETTETTSPAAPTHMPKKSLDLLGDFEGLSADPSPAAPQPTGMTNGAFNAFGQGTTFGNSFEPATGPDKRRTSWTDLHDKGLVDENNILGVKSEQQREGNAEEKSLSLAELAEKQRKEKAASIGMAFGGYPSNQLDPFAAPAAQPQQGSDFSAFGQPAAPAAQPQQQAFGMPQQGFGAPQQQFGAPQQQFGAPQQQFGAPQQQFGAPQQQFGAPQQQFGAPQQQFGAPQQQFGQQQFGLGGQAMPGMQTNMPAYGGNMGVAPQAAGGMPNYGGGYGVSAGGAAAISSMGSAAVPAPAGMTPVRQQQPKKDVNINPFDF